MTDDVRRGAILSECGRYRYTLTREWGGENSPCVAFVGLNPSTADHMVDDPTLRRCVAFARAWGFGRMMLVNLYAWRETVPSDMFTLGRMGVDIVGPVNDTWLDVAMQSSPCVVAAWGSNPYAAARAQEVRSRFKGRLWYLRLTKNGSPEHPLYLPGHLTPQPYDWKPAESF
jgi:hypothetical protein